MLISCQGLPQETLGVVHQPERSTSTGGDVQLLLLTCVLSGWSVKKLTEALQEIPSLRLQSVMQHALLHRRMS